MRLALSVLRQLPKQASSELISLTTYRFALRSYVDALTSSPLRLTFLPLPLTSYLYL